MTSSYCHFSSQIFIATHNVILHLFFHFYKGLLCYMLLLQTIQGLRAIHITNPEHNPVKILTTLCWSFKIKLSFLYRHNLDLIACVCVCVLLYECILVINKWVLSGAHHVYSRGRICLPRQAVNKAVKYPLMKNTLCVCVQANSCMQSKTLTLNLCISTYGTRTALH